MLIPFDEKMHHQNDAVYLPGGIQDMEAAVLSWHKPIKVRYLAQVPARDPCYVEIVTTVHHVALLRHSDGGKARGPLPEMEKSGVALRSCG